MDRIAVDSPFGPVQLYAQDGAITRVGWGPVETPSTDPVLREAAAELRAYFQGTLREFTIPIHHGRTDAAGRVLDAMLAIPFGETLEYGDISRQVGLPAQAVGQACGANHIPLLIPCHRVLSATGLGGFSAPGGIETKVWLLRHEGAAGLLI